MKICEDSDDAMDTGEGTGADPPEDPPVDDDLDDVFDDVSDTDNPPTDGTGDDPEDEPGGPIGPIPPLIGFPQRPNTNTYTATKPTKKDDETVMTEYDMTEFSIDDIEVTDWPDVILPNPDPTVKEADPNVWQRDPLTPSGTPYEVDSDEPDVSDCHTRFSGEAPSDPSNPNPHPQAIERPEIQETNTPVNSHINEMDSILNQINAYRATKGLTPWSVDIRLTQQALDQTTWVSDNPRSMDNIVDPITGIIKQGHPIEGYPSGMLSDERRLNFEASVERPLELMYLGSKADMVAQWIASGLHRAMLESPQHKSMGVSYKTAPRLRYGGVGFMWIAENDAQAPPQNPPPEPEPVVDIKDTALDIAAKKLNSPYKCPDHPDYPNDLQEEPELNRPSDWQENLSIAEMQAIDELLKDSYDPVYRYHTAAGPGLYPPTASGNSPWLGKNSSVWPRPNEFPFPNINTVYTYDATVCGEYASVYGTDDPVTNTVWDYQESEHTPYEGFRKPETSSERKHRLAKEQQFLVLYDNKYGGLKTPPTLPVWVSEKGWTVNELTELYEDFGRLVYEMDYSFDMNEVKDPYGNPFGTPQEFIAFNYWLYHRQSTPVSEQPPNRGDIPGERINFMESTSPHWQVVPDFAETDADFPFPPAR
ncbi:unknown protein [Seminavis robusta]|uniref:SCP domain-containing protein n=1 Tax=Seminavis robusta TaxID=568900 RepID=A0A9N8HVT9_9STRA|nr:unknown protein [Seminavis robusta]|eukprot:Sro2006_g310540.1 n/a (648) ;mRNA; r:3977-6071